LRASNGKIFELNLVGAELRRHPCDGPGDAHALALRPAMEGQSQDLNLSLSLPPANRHRSGAARADGADPLTPIFSHGSPTSPKFS
jgi:hypothetical protein